MQKLKSSNPTGDTFKVVALEWYAKQKDRWSPGHAERLQRQLERDLFPWLGERRLREIEAVELLATLRKVEERGAIETADRGLMLARQVWCYGVATGRVERDITADLKGALQPYRGRHFAAITEPAQFGELLRAIRAYKGGPIVRAALQLAPMLFQRPGELRAAAWTEMDLDAALWTIPAARMKREKEGKEYGSPHLVPLPTQAVAALRDLYRLTGHGTLVFPGERSHDRPISENSVRTALITMGYTPEVQTWHGFRATARTMLAEVLEVDPLVIEAQLAHAVKDANGRAYNRTQYVNQRKQMMQRWADYLDALREQNRAIVEPSVQQVRGAKKGESMASLVRNFLHAADPFDTPNVLREGRLEAQEILPAPRTLLNDTERRAQSKKKREGKQSMAELAADAVAAMTHSAAKR
ncbi:putative prophage CPS-53 integrase [compost metagenome]